MRCIGCTISELVAEIQHVVIKAAESGLVVARVKDPGTLEKKMLRKNTRDVFSIHDVYGIRVVVSTVREAYSVLGRIQGAYPGFIDHDYIAEPKTRPEDPAVSGKRLRLLQYIAHKNGVPFEIQITTVEFDSANEELHERYSQRVYGDKGL